MLLDTQTVVDSSFPQLIGQKIIEMNRTYSVHSAYVERSTMEIIMQDYV